MSAFDPYVGLPWLERGRAVQGCDCWGLLCLVYGRELAIDLPSHADDYAGTSDRRAIVPLVTAGLADWIAIPAGRERPFDAVLMRQAPWHVGIVTGRGRMLHMPEGGTSRIEPYAGGRFGDRLEGFYRHRKMMTGEAA